MFIGKNQPVSFNQCGPFNRLIIDSPRFCCCAGGGGLEELGAPIEELESDHQKIGFDIDGISMEVLMG